MHCQKIQTIHFAGSVWNMHFTYQERGSKGTLLHSMKCDNVLCRLFVQVKYFQHLLMNLLKTATSVHVKLQRQSKIISATDYTCRYYTFINFYFCFSGEIVTFRNEYGNISSIPWHTLHMIEIICS